MLRHERSPECKIIVLLGEVGGTLEYEVVEAIRNKEITKPVVAWCTGTSAEAFPYGVQFGHAGASAGDDCETASAKNKAFREVGAFVPESFEGFGELLRKVFEKCVREKVFAPVERIKPPHVFFCKKIKLTNFQTNICVISFLNESNLIQQSRLNLNLGHKIKTLHRPLSTTHGPQNSA